MPKGLKPEDALSGKQLTEVMMLMKFFRETPPSVGIHLLEPLPFVQLGGATVLHFFQHAPLDEVMICYESSKHLCFERALNFAKFKNFVSSSLEFNITLGRGHPMFLTAVRTYFRSAIERWEA